MKKYKKIRAVYLIYRDGKVIYVGRTVNLARRIRFHVLRGKLESVDQVKFAVAHYFRERRALECQLIHHFKPVFNKCIPRKRSWDPKFVICLETMEYFEITN
jgi:excinuclease UvrABC nuclease subunit